MTVSAAGERYEEIITPHNEDINAIGYAAESGQPWTDVRALVAKAYQDNDAEAKNLASTAWPSSVTRYVDELVQDDLAERQRWSDAANATNERDFDALLKIVYQSPDGGQDAATSIRSLLGLEGPGNAPPLTSSAAS